MMVRAENVSRRGRNSKIRQGSIELRSVSDMLHLLCSTENQSVHNKYMTHFFVRSRPLLAAAVGTTLSAHRWQQDMHALEISGRIMHQYGA